MSLFLSFLSGPLHSARAANFLFSRPHLLPSPLTLPSGTLVYGTSLALGVTDSLQVGTDLFRLFFRIWNANARVNLVESDEVALGVGVAFERYNLRDIDARNPDSTLTTLRPGAVAAFSLVPEFAVFAGGHGLISSPPPKRDGIEKSGFVRGADAELDFAWAYQSSGGSDSPAPRKGAKRAPTAKRPSSPSGNSLAFGVSYDFTYRLAGFGLSYHFPGFQIGIHWYPAADRNPVLPILAGGGSVSF